VGTIFHGRPSGVEELFEEKTIRFPLENYTRRRMISEYVDSCKKFEFPSNTKENSVRNVPLSPVIIEMLPSV
jgi:hypothetical protein